ncbi:MAG: ATP-binding protein [Eudoraea sp.]|uniref:AAA family ATPase n=1 Tax=Eudoraea sp. TaxID=1979955 RepID=UPI003C71DF32
MKSKKVVITGGPSTGKTVIIQQLEARGYTCFHEIVRSMTLAAKKKGNPESFVSNPLAFVKDPFEFNKRILSGRKEQYKESHNINKPYIFFDRGIPDVLAYMDYFDHRYTRDFEVACKTNRYDKVLILPPWKQIYVSDNERLESFEEAIEIHDHLNRTYTRYDYEPVLIPTGTVEERISFILNELKED